MTALMKETVTDAGEEGKKSRAMHTYITRTSRTDSALPLRPIAVAVVPIRTEMKIFATQIGSTLMKVISLGKQRDLIRKMRIDSATPFSLL